MVNVSNGDILTLFLSKRSNSGSMMFLAIFLKCAWWMLGKIIGLEYTDFLFYCHDWLNGFKGQRLCRLALHTGNNGAISSSCGCHTGTYRKIVNNLLTGASLHPVNLKNVTLLTTLPYFLPDDKGCIQEEEDGDAEVVAQRPGDGDGPGCGEVPLFRTAQSLPRPQVRRAIHLCCLGELLVRDGLGYALFVDATHSLVLVRKAQHSH